jgi:sulfate transport system ATP-binding protein
MSIHLKDITKRFGTFQALDGVSLDVPDGELVALLGPSGSGKTTLLRILAGLETPDGGQVTFQGGGEKRRVGFVFQHYALFRHQTVFENVAFGLRVRPWRERPSRPEIRERVQKVLDLVQLGWAGPRMPDQLSGGQRQRIALARALAVEPEVLLLDEPFGALDARVRADLRRWLRSLHDQTGITSVFVTHDQEEALEVADRIVVLNRGRVEQDGTPQAVYEAPASPFVYQFLGQVNRVRGRMGSGGLEIGGTTLAVAGEAPADGAEAAAFLRPHDLQVGLEATPGALPARVLRLHRAGPFARVHLEALHDGGALEAHVSREDLERLDLQPGQIVHALPRRLGIFAATQAQGDSDWVI